MKKSFIGLLCLVMSSSILFSQESKRYLLPFPEIFKIMQDSKLVYEPDIKEDSSFFNFPKYETISDQYYVTLNGDEIYLQTYSLSDKGKQSLDNGELAFAKADYDTAIKYYRDVLISDSGYYKAYTFIGDAYYAKENYDSAKYYFNYAIKHNYADYSAHWFLADAYQKTDDIDSAVKEITIAHLLNRNHQNLFERLKEYRELSGKKWNDWELNPVSNTYKKDGKVIIETTNAWMGYAFAEAVWKFEPGFTENIFGKPYDSTDMSYQKEAACVVANLASESLKDGLKIAQDGYFEEMVWYEIMGRRYPASILILPREFFDKMVEYVNKYH